MKILVVGFGSIGRRHIRNIKSIDANIKIAVWRQFNRVAELGDLAPLVENVFFLQDEALGWKPDVAFVTNPAPMHLDTALMFARNNSHLFIEKPLSVDDSGLGELLKECERRNRVLMVGYVLRFSEPLKILKKTLEQGRIGNILSIKASVGQHLLNWRRGQRYQDTVTGRKDLGGGVLLELSHELDYVRWLVGEATRIHALMSKVSNLEIDVEDIAEICLKFKCGALGNVHLDMLDHATNRSCRIIGTEGTVAWNSSDDNCVRLYSAKTARWEDLYISKEEDKNEMYMAELRHFFDCVTKNKVPLVSGEEGRRVVKLIMATRCSAERGEAISL